MTEFWQVSPAEVANIDRALLEFVRRQKTAPTELEQYGRQYLGFSRGTRRYVFINAIPRGVNVTPAKSEAELIAVCDNTWGVEYDVDTQQFANLGIDGGPSHR